MCNCEGKCSCCGWSVLIIGLLAILQYFLWPQWSGIDGWVVFFSVIAVVYGLFAVLMSVKKCTGECKDKCCKEEPKEAALVGQPKVEATTETEPVVSSETKAAKKAKKKK